MGGRSGACGAPRRPAVLVLAALLAFSLSAQHGAAIEATPNTPGGVRVVEVVTAGPAGATAAAAVAGDGATAGARPLVRQPLASGQQQQQLFFQSLPTFPEAEAQALATFTGILRSPSGSSQGSGEGGSFSAADAFLAALLKTTRASLAGSRPAVRVVRRPAGSSSSSSSSEPPAAGSDDLGPDPEGAGDGDSPAANEPDGGSDAGAVPPAEEAVTDAAVAATLSAAPVAEPQQQQQLADPASAVDGQVLVTEAEILPSMQQWGQVVVSSLKMRPTPALDLTRAAGSDAPVWQDGLKQALEAATALAANVSVTHIHTKMTSIVNLGLELAEPPMEHASAAASALANSVKALTGDESVLVGVSFIRLAGGAAGSNASSSSSASAGTQAHQAQSSILALLTLYGVGPPASAVALVQRMQQACPELFVHAGSLNASSCGQTVLGRYEAALAPAPAAAPAAAAAAALPAATDAEALGREEGPSRSLLQFSGPAGFGGDRQPLPIRRGNSILASLGVQTGRAHGHSDAGSSAFSSTGAGVQAAAGLPVSSRKSSDVSASEEDEHEPEEEEAEEGTDNSPEAPALAKAEAAAAAAPSVAFIRVCQQPEVNIIITHAVGVPAGQQATTIASKLQTLTSSTALAQLLALSGLSLAQAGKPQVLDMQAANSAGFAANSAMAAAVAAAVAAETAAEHSSKAEQIAAAGGKSGGHVAAWVAAAVAVSVVAVSTAAVAIVIVKQRTKQARARSESEDDQLPKSSKRRARGSKGGKPASRYLPSSHAIMLPAMSAGGGDGGAGMPSPPCVIVTAVGSPTQHQLACCTPLSAGAGLSPLKPRLAAQGSAPLAGTPGSGTRLHGPQTPVHAVAVQGAFNAPPLARGDSVSSAVLADLQDGQQDSSNNSSDSEEQEEPCHHSSTPVHRVHRLQHTDSAGSPRHSWSLAAHEQQQQQQLPAADGQHTLRVRNSSAAERESPMQQLKQQWQVRDCNSPASPSHMVSHHQHQQHQQQQHVLVHWSSWGPAASGAAAASPGASGPGPSESMRLFSRPVSETSLPDDLRQVLASAAAAAAAAASAGAGGEPSACSSGSQQAAAEHAEALAQQHQFQQVVCRHSKLSSCGSGGSPCSVRATPFLAAYDFSCLGDGPTSSGGATTPLSPGGQQQARVVVASASALRAAHEQQQQLEPPSGSSAGADTPTSQGRPRVSPFMLRDNIPPGVE